MSDAPTTDPLATPPATGDRLIVITQDDHRGVLWVVSMLCLIYIVLLLGVRSGARRREFGWDDWVAAGSTISGTVYYILIFISIKQGFGKVYADISPSHADTIGVVAIVGNVFFFLTIALTKVALILLCRRLFITNMKKHLFLCDVASGLVGLWFIASVLATIVACGPMGQLGYRQDFCTSMVGRWIGVAIADGVLEIMLVVLATTVVYPLQMETVKKRLVIMSFAPRLLLLILIGLHVYELDQATTASRRGIAIVSPTVYLLVQLLYAVFSSAIPALNRWLRNFDSGMGGSWQATTQQYGTGHSASGDKKKQTSFLMNTLQSNGSASRSGNRSARRSVDEEPINHDTNFRPDPINYAATVSGHDQTEVGSSKSHESQHSEAKIIRKEQRWQIDYHYDYNDNIHGASRGQPHAR